MSDIEDISDLLGVEQAIKDSLPSFDDNAIIINIEVSKKGIPDSHKFALTEEEYNNIMKGDIHFLEECIEMFKFENGLKHE